MIPSRPKSPITKEDRSLLKAAAESRTLLSERVAVRGLEKKKKRKSRYWSRFGSTFHERQIASEVDAYIQPQNRDKLWDLVGTLQQLRKPRSDAECFWAEDSFVNSVFQPWGRSIPTLEDAYSFG